MGPGGILADSRNADRWGKRGGSDSWSSRFHRREALAGVSPTIQTGPVWALASSARELAGLLLLGDDLERVSALLKDRRSSAGAPFEAFPVWKKRVELPASRLFAPFSVPRKKEQGRNLRPSFLENGGALAFNVPPIPFLGLRAPRPRGDPRAPPRKVSPRLAFLVSFRGPNQARRRQYPQVGENSGDNFGARSSKTTALPL